MYRDLLKVDLSLCQIRSNNITAFMGQNLLQSEEKDLLGFLINFSQDLNILHCKNCLQEVERRRATTSGKESC